MRKRSTPKIAINLDLSADVFAAVRHARGSMTDSAWVSRAIYAGVRYPDRLKRQPKERSQRRMYLELSPLMVAAVDRLAGRYKRTRFIRDCIHAELDRLRVEI